MGYRARCSAACAFVLVPEVDAALGKVIHRQFQRHAVARENTDVVLAHAARRVRTDHDAVVERHAVAAIGKHFVDNAVQLDEFFFRHI